MYTALKIIISTIAMKRPTERCYIITNKLNEFAHTRIAESIIVIDPIVLYTPLTTIVSNIAINCPTESCYIITNKLNEFVDTQIAESITTINKWKFTVKGVTVTKTKAKYIVCCDRQ